MRIKESHNCIQHEDICTFSAYAKFCTGVDASKPLDVQLGKRPVRGRCFSPKSMMYYVLGALRANALKRFTDHQQRYPKASTSNKNPCFSDDDSASDRDQKTDFKLKVYTVYWAKVCICSMVSQCAGTGLNRIVMYIPIIHRVTLKSHLNSLMAKVGNPEVLTLMSWAHN
jgi:hypothetical protein